MVVPPGRRPPSRRPASRGDVTRPRQRPARPVQRRPAASAAGSGGGRRGSSAFLSAPSSSSRSHSGSGSSAATVPGSGFSSRATATAGAGDQTVGDGRGDHPGQQLGRADRVVVARDREVDLVRVAVGVEHRDDRDAQLAGLVDGDVLLLGVDDPDRRRDLRHVPQAAEGLGELDLLAVTAAGSPSWCSPAAVPVRSRAPPAPSSAAAACTPSGSW